MKTQSLVAFGAAIVLAGGIVHADQAAPRAAAQTSAPAANADLSGIWMVRYSGYRETRSAPMTPWAAALFKERQDNGYEDPGALCLLPGVPRDMGAPYPLEIIQTPNIVYILHEYQHMVRRIFIGGTHPDDLDPSFMGHSIGHWEGDTLVVDTVGRNDRTWLAPTGVPHSDQIHVVERLKKSADGKTLQNVAEIDDPKAFTKKWTLTNTYDARPEMELMEYICQENNRALTK